MSREIKFRAWNHVQKVMLGAISIEDLLTEPPLSKSGVDELIIMQYTGLKDGNGAEIYEGDIIEIDGFARVVKFVEFKKEVYGHGCCDFTHILGFNFNSRSGNKPVVIGNIYQNKELLDDI